MHKKIKKKTYQRSPQRDKKITPEVDNIDYVEDGYEDDWYYEDEDE